MSTVHDARQQRWILTGVGDFSFLLRFGFSAVYYIICLIECFPVDDLQFLNTSNWQFSNRVQFVLDVTNETAKDIKGVSDVLVIKDLFGKDIKKLQCDFTGQTIPAGSTTTFTDLGYDINEFMDEDVKCYNEDFSDLNFEYEVQKVVYSDGTSEEM